MSVAAATAIRAWVNGRRDLVGEGMPFPLGAFRRPIESPADGAYCVISRTGDPPSTVGAEDNRVGISRIQALCYAGTIEASEFAASALRDAFESLRGCPEACGDTNVLVLVCDSVSGPAEMPVPPDSGEIFCNMVTADLVLTAA
jgi:hypothetical protein